MQRVTISNPLPFPREDSRGSRLGHILILYFVPQLPPAFRGVGDYATLVGRKLEELRPDTKCVYSAYRNSNIEVSSVAWL
jgi:hypothetical protein